MKKLLLTLSVASLAVAMANGATNQIYKADNADDLFTGTSWIGGVPPVSTNTAVWDSTVTVGHTATCGQTTTWKDIQILDPGGVCNLRLSASRTLTLADGGIDASAATTNWNVVMGSTAYLRFASGNTNANITVAPGRTVTVGTVLVNQGNTKTLSFAGGGNVVLYNTSGGGGAMSFQIIDGTYAELDGASGWATSNTITKGTLGGSGQTDDLILYGGGAIAPGASGNIGTLTIADDGFNYLDWYGASNGVYQMKFDLSTNDSFSDVLVIGSLAQTNSYLTKQAGGDSFYGFDFQGGGKDGETYTLIQFSQLSDVGAGVFTTNDFSYTNLASGLSGVFSMDTNSLKFIVGNPLPPYTPSNIYWAASSGDWDINTTDNWDGGAGPTVYYEQTFVGDYVNFEDTYSGGSPITVTLNASVHPSSVTVDSTKDYTISGTGSIDGDIAVTKSGSGTLTLSTANNFSGNLYANDGSVYFGNYNAVGGSGVIASNGATLRLITSSGFGAPITLNDASSNLVFQSNQGSAGFMNYVYGDANQTMVIDSGGGQAVNFNMQSNKQLQDFYGTVLVKTNANMAFRSTALNQGSDNATFDLVGNLNTRNNGYVALGALTGAGNFNMGGSGSNGGVLDLTIGANGASTTFDGLINDGDTANGKVVNLIKTGAGTLTLTAAQPYTGSTTVNGGTLDIDGAIIGSATVNTNAAIGGGGTIGGDLTMNDGALLAFTSGETLTVSGGLNFTASTFGADDVVGVASNTVEATYTLVNGFTNTLSGLDTATYIIGGHSAYLQAGAGSLQLVVGSGVIPDITSISVSGGSATVYWASGAYNVYTNSSLTNPGGWAVATNTTPPAIIPIGSESTLFFRLGN